MELKTSTGKGGIEIRLVMKFGGTSIGDGEKIRNVAKIVKEYSEENEVVVVLSALEGVTDSLEGIAKTLIKDSKKETIEKFIQEMGGRHLSAIEVAIPQEELRIEVIETVDEGLRELQEVLLGIYFLGEATLRSLDYIMSFGERISAPILSACLRSLGVESKSFMGGEAGLITDSTFGGASPLPESYEMIRDKLEPLLEKEVSVVSGFIAENSDGVITTLGRDGSDYTASIIGTALDADEIWIFTDVDGIMTYNPKIIPEARTIPIISYLEAMELTYFGTSVIHPKAIEPAMNRGIPVRVKNTFNPSNSGTRIVKGYKKDKRVVKAVTAIEDVASLMVAGAGMMGTPGVAARVFSALAKRKINVMMISQGSSEANISMVIEEEKIKDAKACLEEEFGEDLIESIKYNRDICIIAVVGLGMMGTPGVAARVFSALAKRKINVMMISQGSSEANISMVIEAKYGEDAVRALHEAFELERL